MIRDAIVRLAGRKLHYHMEVTGRGHVAAWFYGQPTGPLCKAASERHASAFIAGRKVLWTQRPPSLRQLPGSWQWV